MLPFIGTFGNSFAGREPTREYTQPADQCETLSGVRPRLGRKPVASRQRLIWVIPQLKPRPAEPPADGAAPGGVIPAPADAALPNLEAQS